MTGARCTTLASGKRIPAETVLYSAGRQGATEDLNLEAAGLSADKRGRIEVDEFFRTTVPHIYAVGDVIGFPALAATSMEQGRLAAHHACGEPVHTAHLLQPIGIYSLPEISFIGKTEDQLTAECVPFEVGVSRYRELARGQIIGDSYGVLKLLVSPDDRTLLGVHVFGTGATELVHIGQAVMGCGGTIDYLVDAVFNYPTLAESYKVAALDATNKMRQIERFAGVRRSAAAAGPAAAAAPAGGRRLRAAGRSPAADRDGGQQLHRVVVALRAGAWRGRLAHRAGPLEGVAAGAAAVLVSRHELSLAVLARGDDPPDPPACHPLGPTSGRPWRHGAGWRLGETS